MIANNRPTEEIFVQLAAARSSLASTLSAFIESLLDTKDTDPSTDSVGSPQAGLETGKISLTAEQIRLILRSIK